MYINCKTYFSFLYGTFGTEELVKTAVEKGVTTMALTNINNTCDVWDFVDYCKQQNIKPVAGSEIRNGSELLYILIAKNNKGFGLINRFLSEHLHEKKPFPERPSFENDVYIIYPFGKIALNQLGTDELIGIQSTEINKLFGLSVQFYAHKLVIRQPVTFQNKTYYNVHRLLQAIDKNIILSKQDKTTIASPHETFVPASELMQVFQQYHGIITNTLKVLESCNIDLEFHADKTKKVYSASKHDDKILLEKLAINGMVQRYGSKNKQAKERVNKELQIIDELGFNAYFLITWDIIRYCIKPGLFSHRQRQWCKFNCCLLPANH